MRRRFGSLWAVGLLLWGAPAAAQVEAGPERTPARFDYSVRGMDVDQALAILVDMTGVDLLFDASVSTGRSVTCRREQAAPEELLRCIVDSAELDFYRLSSGTYVVIDRPEDIPAYGVLTGIVVDARNGRPIPWAEVMIDGLERRTVANASGHFLVSGLLPGRVQVITTRIGYAEATLVAGIEPSRSTRARIEMAPAAFQMAPIVVRGIEPPRSAEVGSEFRARLGEGGLTEVADGLSGSASGALGVGRAPFVADLSVQGGDAGENPVRLDGVPIYEPLSLGRTRSAFSPLALQELRLRKAGFGASSGSYLSGAVDLSHSYVTSPDVPAVTGTVDPYAVNARVAIPFGGRADIGSGEQTGGIMVSGRASLWNLYREPNLDRAIRGWNAVDPVLTRQLLGDRASFTTDGLLFDPLSEDSDVAFSDLHATMRLPLGPFSRLEGSLYRGGNEVGTELFAGGVQAFDSNIEQALLTRDAYDWSNIGGQLSWHGLIGSGGAALIRVRGSQHKLDHTYELAEGSEVGFVPGFSDIAAVGSALKAALDARIPARDANQISEFGLDVHYDRVLGHGHRLSTGLEVSRVEGQSLMNDPYLRPVYTTLGHWRSVLFLEDRWSFSPWGDLEVGGRATRTSDRDRVWFEPRAAINARGSSPVGSWSARVAGGIYHQFVNRFELSTVGPSALVPEVTFWMPTDASVDVPRSRHLSAEVVVQPAAGWELRLEGWRKWFDRLLDLNTLALFDFSPQAAVDQVDQAAFLSQADGDAEGLGVRLTRTTLLGSWQLGYERSESERTYPGRFEGARQPIASNQPHLAFMTFDVDAGRGIRMIGEGRGVWGRTWGLRRAYYDFLPFQEQDPGSAPSSLPEEDTLPPLIEFDLGIGWSGQLGRAGIEAQLVVKNAFDRRNVLDRALWRESGVDQEEGVWVPLDRNLPGRTPVLTIRILPN